MRTFLPAPEITARRATAAWERPAGQIVPPTTRLAVLIARPSARGSLTETTTTTPAPGSTTLAPTTTSHPTTLAPCPVPVQVWQAQFIDVAVSDTYGLQDAPTYSRFADYFLVSAPIDLELAEKDVVLCSIDSAGRWWVTQNLGPRSCLPTTQSPCGGECRWRWDSGTGAWVQTSSACRSGCACPKPMWCGDELCAGTSTSCVHNPSSYDPCTSTTAGPTTSTSPPTTVAPGSGECWVCRDGNPGEWYGFGGYNLSTDCSCPPGTAPCWYVPPLDPCQCWNVGCCSAPTTTQGPPPGGTHCIGSVYVNCAWDHASNSWTWDKAINTSQHDCGPCCTVDMPHGPCDCGDTIRIPCRCSKAEDYYAGNGYWLHCSECQPTSTAPPGCQGTCLHRGNGSGGWILKRTNCQNYCTCQIPPWDSTSNCDEVMTGCIDTTTTQPPTTLPPTTTTTTTIPPTTTTQAPPPCTNCIWVAARYSSFYSLTHEGCIAPACGGCPEPPPLYPGICDTPGGCFYTTECVNPTTTLPPSTTTTTTTTTTAPPTSGPPTTTTLSPCVSGGCHYTCGFNTDTFDYDWQVTGTCPPTHCAPCTTNQAVLDAAFGPCTAINGGGTDTGTLDCTPL